MWQLEQLEKLREIEPDIVDHAIEELLSSKTDLKEKVVIGAYLDGQINFGKAAELLGVHPMRLREEFLKRGIPIKIGVETEEELIAEISSAEEMKRSIK